MASKRKILAELEESRSAVLQHLEAVPEAAWDMAGPGVWSPAEIADHIARVEEATITGLRRAESTDGPRPQLTFRQRFLAVPPLAIRFPLLKVDAPSWVRPEAIPSREEAKRKLVTVRRHLLAYLDSRGDAELNGLAVRHPFFGWMSAAHLLRLLAAHDRRHIVQMRKTVEQNLRKPRARAVAA